MTKAHLGFWKYFYSTGANIKKLLGVIYASSSVFPFDFQWGCADRDIIMSIKVL
jgi:hypothetical protein